MSDITSLYTVPYDAVLSKCTHRITADDVFDSERWNKPGFLPITYTDDERVCLCLHYLNLLLGHT